MILNVVTWEGPLTKEDVFEQRPTTARASFGLEKQPQALRPHQKGRGLGHEEDMGIDSQ